MTYLAGNRPPVVMTALPAGEGADFGDDALALLKDGGAASVVNRTIHAAAAEQRGVGGVHDGLGSLLGDVGGAVELERLAVRKSQSGCEVGHVVLKGSPGNV